MLSNTTETTAHSTVRWDTTLTLLRFFSYELGVEKPQKRAYEILLQL